MKRNWAALLTILVVAIAWGATFTVVKNVLSHIAPEPFIFWRFTLAGAILCAIAIQRRQALRPVARSGIILGGLVFVGYWLQTRGLMVITPSRSAFLTGLYVVMVPFCDRIIRGTRISAQAWTGSILAVVGTTALIGGLDARPTLGDVMTLLCAFCFALHVVYSADFTARHPAIALAAVQVLFVGIAAGPPSLLAPRAAFRTDVGVVIVFTAVVTTALAFVALMWGQARVTATEAAVILAVEPLAASFTSILAGEEHVTAAFVLGGTMILAGMVVSQLRR
ncbi:MAG: DMT family transporter [Thermoanaerobaculia bacterium]